MYGLWSVYPVPFSLAFLEATFFSPVTGGIYSTYVDITEYKKNIKF